jgi:hypothetical protein
MQEVPKFDNIMFPHFWIKMKKQKIITEYILYETYEITLLKKAQSLNIKVDKDYEIVHERMI